MAFLNRIKFLIISAASIIFGLLLLEPTIGQNRCRYTNLLYEKLAFQGHSPVDEGLISDPNTFSVKVEDEYVAGKLVTLIGMFWWKGFREGSHTQTLYKLGEIFEVVIRRDSISDKYDPQANCMKWNDGKLCKCFGDYVQPKDKLGRCTTKDPTMVNCMVVDPIDPKKCIICNEMGILTEATGKCSSGKTKACAVGCLYCTLTECQVCDKGFLKEKTSQSRCVKEDALVADRTWAVSRCQNVDLRGANPACWACEHGWFLEDNDINVCKLIQLEDLGYLQGCRVGEQDTKYCEECLPGYKQVEDDNSWCHPAGTNTTISIRKNTDSYSTQTYGSIGLDFDLKPNTRFLIVNSLNLDPNNKENRPFELYISTKLDDMPFLFFNVQKSELNVEKLSGFGVEESSKTFTFFGGSIKCASARTNESPRASDGCYDHAYWGHIDTLMMYPFYLTAHGAWNYTIPAEHGSTFEDYINPDITDYHSIFLQILRSFDAFHGC